MRVPRHIHKGDGRMIIERKTLKDNKYQWKRHTLLHQLICSHVTGVG